MKTPTLFIFLAACGEVPAPVVDDGLPRFHPAEVAELYREAFDAIASGVNAAAGYDAFAYDPENGSGRIVIDDAEIDKWQSHYPYRVINGLGRPGEVIMPTPDGKRGLPVHLAHELGHALGLKHTDEYDEQGLMRPQGDFRCVGREAECLIAAMRAAGVIP